MERCQSCGFETNNICQSRGAGKFTERTNPMLYICYNCKVTKCNNCIGNMKLCYNGDNTSPVEGWKHYEYKYTNEVPDGHWIEFISRRGLTLHSCSQICQDAYEELD